MPVEHDESRWLSLAESISTGTPVNWDEVEHHAAADQEDIDVVRALRAIHEIARVHASSPLDTTPAARSAGAVPQRWRHFAILECVGRGAFGAVYRAREEGLDREVALKLLRPRSGGAPGEQSPVLYDGRLPARVRHPNVVTVYGADLAEGRIGVWMEFIKGRTLEDVLAAQGPFGAREAAAIGLDLCGALAAVHGAGLLHRDLKARNVMREEGGRTVLMDFGAGTDVDVNQESVEPDVAGTPLYLAPEIFAGRTHTPQSELYSLGVLLYHLVTRAYPVEGRTSVEIRDAHGRHERKRLRDVRPDLPQGFVHVVERALSYEPQKRYESAGEFADGLAAFLGVSSASQQDTRRSPHGRSSTPAPFGQRNWRLLAAAAAVVLAVVLAAAAGGVWLWRTTSGSRAIAGQSIAGGRSGAADPASGQAAIDAARMAPPASPVSYEIVAAFHAVKNGTDAVLHAGARLAPGDTLFLTVQASTPAYVYVINQDEQGESYLLFPLPGQSLTNPLPAGTVNRLPGPQSGREFYWQVTSAGGREHFFVFASPERLDAIETMAATLTRPRLDQPVLGVPLSAQAVGVLRGVGGLAKAAPTPAAAGGSLGFPFATPLLETAEQARGLWAREITFANPPK